MLRTALTITARPTRSCYQENPTYQLLSELDHLPRLGYRVSAGLLGDRATSEDLTALYDTCLRIVDACRRTGRIEVKR